MQWKRIEPTRVEKVGWRTIVTKTFLLPNGKKHNFQTVNPEATHNAGVLALTHDRRVIIARQYRPGPEATMFEIPGGGVESHETEYQMAALRELKEETGYVPGKVTSLGFVYKDAFINSTWHYYLAEDCVLHADGTHHDDTEFIKVELITIKELIENAKNGLMTDTEAVLLAYDKLKEIQGEK